MQLARTVEDDALLARFNRLLGKDEPKPTVEANPSHEFNTWRKAFKALFS